MKNKMEIAWNLGKTVFVLSYCIIVFLGIKGCVNDASVKSDARVRDHAEYRARLPKTGERIMLDGKEVAIVKEYVWSSKFQVRYPDGTMADVSEKEMLDKKPIKKLE